MKKRDTQSSDEFQEEYHKKKMSYKSKVLRSNMQNLYSRRKLVMNFRIILQEKEISGKEKLVSYHIHIKTKIFYLLNAY